MYTRTSTIRFSQEEMQGALQQWADQMFAFVGSTKVVWVTETEGGDFEIHLQKHVPPPITAGEPVNQQAEDPPPDGHRPRREPVICPHCGIETRGLKVHIRAKHPEMIQHEPVACPHCGIETRGLKDHIRAKHPEMIQQEE